MPDYSMSHTGEDLDETIQNYLNIKTNNNSILTPLSTPGTTGLFLRGDGTWSNELIGSLTATTFIGHLLGSADILNNLGGRIVSPSDMIADGNMRLYLSTGSMTTDKPPTGDGHILHFSWDNDGGWDNQLAIGNRDTGGLAWRGGNGNGSGTTLSWTSWYRVLDTYNSASLISTINNTVHINPPNGSWVEGIRLHCASSGWATICLCGADNTGASGTSANSWSLHAYLGAFYLARNGSSGGTSNFSCNTSNVWTFTGAVRGTSWTNTSSILVKENVIDMTNNEAKKLLNVRTVSFDYKEIAGGLTNQFGVIAEEVEKIIPYVVDTPEKNENSEGLEISFMKGVDYSKFIPYLIKLCQIQLEEINTLKQQIILLEQGR